MFDIWLILSLFLSLYLLNIGIASVQRGEPKRVMVSGIIFVSNWLLLAFFSSLKTHANTLLLIIAIMVIPVWVIGLFLSLKKAKNSSQ